MHKFIEYPTITQTLDFSKMSDAVRGPIEARSTDGLMVTFSAQFQYTLDQKDLLNLYTRYGDDYRSPCIRFAVDTLNDQASQFEASAFFKNLTTVAMNMQEKLKGIWAKECFSTVQSL
jgi:hypothetical protein